jgi:LysM repeat protein
MRTLLLVFITIFIFQFSVRAQGSGELMVTVSEDTWNITHTVQRGETVFMLARRYHVPPAILADANKLSYQDGLRVGSTIAIPLGAYNLQTVKPGNMADARSLYYKVKSEDNLYRISRHAGLPQRTLVQWNNLQSNEVTLGQKLLVGWVLYDATQIAAPAATVPPAQVTVATLPVRKPAEVVRPVPARPAPSNTPPVSEVVLPVTSPMADTNIGTPQPVVTLQDLFEEQTMQGQNIVWEKGAAAFFSMTTQAKGASVYAFHNKAAKGSVIRVKNMNNGRIVYVKVLGPVPMTKQYHNCIIGLSSSAKAALGVRDDKAFCELSYAGY